MKKFLFLSLLSAVIATTTQAQNGAGPSAPQQKPTEPAVVLQQMKDQQVPGLVAKAGLTEAQANKLIELNFEMRQAAGGLRDLSEADRAAKIQELKAAKDKKISELLTADQIAAVKKYYEDMGKERQLKSRN